MSRLVDDMRAEADRLAVRAHGYRLAGARNLALHSLDTAQALKLAALHMESLAKVEGART